VLQVLAAFGLVTSITLLTGWLANRGVTDHPPLAVLRQET
jgi:putative ABC transport system permease protein